MNKIIFKIKKNIIEKWHYFVVLILAVVFFVATSSLNYLTQSYGNPDFVKWASPDETANYIFTKHYAQTKTISIFEKDNLVVNDIIRPRSLRSDNGTIKPVSFLGIILIYGQIAAWTSYKVIPYLTPLFASIGLFYFYALVKKIFGKNNALISVFLLASFPPYVYYTMRSMFHNVLFTVLLTIGLYYIVAMVRKKIKVKKEEQIWWWFTSANWHGIICAALAGLFLGLAASVRTSELLWLGPALAVLWLFNLKKAGFIKPLVVILFAVLALLPTFYYNQLLYDSFYLGGYAEMNKSIVNIKDASADALNNASGSSFKLDKNFVGTLKENILVFGMHPRQSYNMLKYYFIEMFPWIFWPGLFGFIIYLGNWHKFRYRHWVYFLCLSIVSIILILYYGSWIFYDNPNRANHTIGNSYTRYWLPIYLGVLPLVSLLIMRLSRIISWPLKSLNHKQNLKSNFFSFRFSRKLLYNSLRMGAVAVIFFFSANFLLYGSEEGLLYLIKNQQEAKKDWTQVMNLTEDDSTIITLYHDKLFFPERKVIVGLFDDQNMNQEYAKLVNLASVYYYNFNFQENDLEYLNSTRLASVGLQIKNIKKINDKFTLYQLYKQATTTDKMLK